MMNKTSRLNLRAKILLSTIAIISAAVIAVGGYLLYNNYNELTQKSIQGLAETANAKGEGIRDFLLTARNDVLYLSRSPALQNYLTADEETRETQRQNLEKEYYEFARAQLNYDQIRFLDLNGQEIVRVNTSRGGVSTIVPKADLQNKSDRAYFTDSVGLFNGSIYISALDLNVERGKIEEPHKPVIRYATPVYLNGEVYGVVVVNILADYFLDPLGEGTDTFLVDKDGYYMYHEDESKRWGRDLGTEITVRQDYPSFGDALFSGYTSSFNDGQTLFAYTPIILSGDRRAESSPRWYLASSQPVQEAFAAANRALGVGLLIMLASLVIGAGAVNLLVRPVVTSVEKLTETARQVAAGNLSAVAEVRARDEVGVLAETFNAMTAQLRESIRTLDERVAERTRNLELAAEVGRAVSQVRDLDVMLKDACELILMAFNLYYVQVYLTNPGGATLKLEAGTGSVGTELLGRGHSLRLDTGSINGRAAVEKRSVVIADTASSPTFRQNPLLPETRGEMAVPLIVADKVVGVLDMQSDKSGILTEEVLPAFEALAGQLAIAIQNANSLAEVQTARAEVEAQSRRLTRSNWTEYLDAIHRPEKTGFVFEQNKVVSLAEAKETGMSEYAVAAPIAITGEDIGDLVVELDSEPAAQSQELVRTVARQVAQQIESLRLLESAERYRAEAEEASRRITREGWRDYLYAGKEKDKGYFYDLKEVRPVDSAEDRLPAETAITLPLRVRDESIGKISVQGVTPDDKDSIDLAGAIAERLGAHIESLRLNLQTEQALATTRQFGEREQALRQITSAVRGSTDPAVILRAAVRELGSVFGRRVMVQMAGVGETPEKPNNGNESSPTSESSSGGAL
ncbi:MAG: GAF domain-containing protein [Chloroflexi bacterium]|nr:GAF domain-containing protein [Chloroflexota bacterium]